MYHSDWNSFFLIWFIIIQLNNKMHWIKLLLQYCIKFWGQQVLFIKEINTFIQRKLFVDKIIYNICFYTGVMAAENSALPLPE